MRQNSKPEARSKQYWTSDETSTWASDEISRMRLEIALAKKPSKPMRLEIALAKKPSKPMRLEIALAKKTWKPVKVEWKGLVPDFNPKRLPKAKKPLKSLPGQLRLWEGDR